MQQLHIFYSGEVQGVGFRIAAKRIADSLGIVGWVRNLPDGRVELVIQGEKENLSKMKNLINNKYWRNFVQIDQIKEKITVPFSDFKIIL